MRIVVPHYYKDFKCIGSECTDTCCAGWDVIIDQESYEYYKTVSGEFGNRLNSTMVSDVENSFVLQNGNCPFLNKDNLCDIYNELGEDKLCKTCKTFPRFSEEFGDLREMGISLSCPEAARLILNSPDKIIFELEKNDVKVTTYNDIDYDLFMLLKSSRENAIEILQNRYITLEDRIIQLITFTQNIQEKIDENNKKPVKLFDDLVKKIKILIQSNKEKNKDKINVKNTENNKANISQNSELCLNNTMSQYMNIFKNLEKINDNWPMIMDNAIECLQLDQPNAQTYSQKHAEFNAYYQDKLYEYEHLMVYFMYRYFMKSAYDEDISSKVKLAVVSYLIIKELCVARWIENGYSFSTADQIEIFQIFSKEIEHSDNNLEKLYFEFHYNHIFAFSKLIFLVTK